MRGDTDSERLFALITKETEAAGRKVKASPDDPQYEVESDKTGKTAVHKPGALHEK